MVLPSCPALIIHEDDAFRKSLIATLDENHFTVTFTTDGADAIEKLERKKFEVIIVSLGATTSKAIEYLTANRASIKAGLIILGDANSGLRNHARVADETLLKPVDANYVADRARTYCRS